MGRSGKSQRKFCTTAILNVTENGINITENGDLPLVSG
jgi:hypothetical protein